MREEKKRREEKRREGKGREGKRRGDDRREERKKIGTERCEIRYVDASIYREVDETSAVHDWYQIGVVV